jgi:hypothetical protein
MKSFAGDVAVAVAAAAAAAAAAATAPADAAGLKPVEMNDFSTCTFPLSHFQVSFLR